MKESAARAFVAQRLAVLDAQGNRGSAGAPRLSADEINRLSADRLPTLALLARVRPESLAQALASVTERSALRFIGSEALRMAAADLNASVTTIRNNVNSVRQSAKRLETKANRANRAEQARRRVLAEIDCCLTVVQMAASHPHIPRSFAADLALFLETDCY